VHGLVVVEEVLRLLLETPAHVILNSIRLNYDISSTDSVTRLGEFLPFGRFFSLGSVFKTTTIAQNFLSTFFHGISNVLIWT
jgi:hypothetical protein